MLVVEGQSGMFQMAQPYLYEMYAVALVLAVIAYTKHRSNIVRLVKGEERKTFLTKKSEQ